MTPAQRDLIERAMTRALSALNPSSGFIKALPVRGRAEKHILDVKRDIESALRVIDQIDVSETTSAAEGSEPAAAVDERT